MGHRNPGNSQWLRSNSPGIRYCFRISDKFQHNRRTAHETVPNNKFNIFTAVGKKSIDFQFRPTLFAIRWIRFCQINYAAITDFIILFSALRGCPFEAASRCGLLSYRIR